MIDIVIKRTGRRVEAAYVHARRASLGAGLVRVYDRWVDVVERGGKEMTVVMVIV